MIANRPASVIGPAARRSSRQVGQDAIQSAKKRIARGDHSDNIVKAGKLGVLNVINGSEVLLGAPTIFNKGNIDQFDF